MRATMDLLRENDGWESKQNLQGHVFQASVTMHAYMERSSGGTNQPPGEHGWFIWGITEAQLPILVGAAAGGTVLLLTMLGLLVWRCCQQRNDKEKQYCLQKGEEDGDGKHSSHFMIQSESLMFYGGKSGTHSSHGHSIENVGIDKSTLARSQSAPIKDEALKIVTAKQRPQSQPLQYNVCNVIEVSDQYINGMVQQVIVESHLPNIPEILLQSCGTLEDGQTGSQYSSSGVLDLPIHEGNLHLGRDSTTLKTRSLPTWVRSRPRPLSTEDDLNELYAKVNFSKKRKNRMRNDSAAAIALNKSRSQFIAFPFMHKDTDSLVDNEAVVVYDERTAL